MKKKVLSALIAATIAVGVVGFAACTPGAGQTNFQAYVGVAYGISNGAIGKATVTVLENETVARIDYSEYIVPKASSSFVSTSVTVEAEEAGVVEEGTIEYTIPENYTLVTKTFTAGAATTKAKVALSITPSYLKIGGKYFAYKAGGTVEAPAYGDYHEITSTGALATTGLNTAIQAGTDKALLQWYTEAADMGIFACKAVGDEGVAVGDVYIGNGYFLKVLPAREAAINAAVLTGDDMGEATGLFNRYGTSFDKSSANNTYWTGTGAEGNNKYGFKKNVEAMVEFFTINGLKDFTNDSFTASTGAGVPWKVTATGAEIKTVDGTAIASITDFLGTFGMFKAAYTAAAAQIPA